MEDFEKVEIKPGENQERITKKSAAIEVYKVVEETRAIAVVGIIGCVLSSVLFQWGAVASAMAFSCVLSYKIYKYSLRMKHLKDKYSLVFQTKIKEMVDKKDG